MAATNSELEAALELEAGPCCTADTACCLGPLHAPQDSQKWSLEQIVRRRTICWNACQFGQTHLLHEQIVYAKMHSAVDELLFATTDNKKRTLLHIASRFGSAGCVRLLLDDAGAEVDAMEQYGATPLFFACQAGQLKCAQLLIEHGADPQPASGRWSWRRHMHSRSGSKTHCGQRSAWRQSAEQRSWWPRRARRLS